MVGDARAGETEKQQAENEQQHEHDKRKSFPQPLDRHGLRVPAARENAPRRVSSVASPMAKEENSQDTHEQHRGQPPQARRERVRNALLVLAVAAITAVGLAALILKSQEPAANPSLAELVRDVDPGPIHVHGLGINPADGSLLIATHTGTYRVAPDEDKAELIGENRQDTMGFTIAGPDRFLGSGHPDPNAARERSLSPLLGLIESRDAGRSWQPISLSGQADFHVLRFAGRRVYGYDATNDRLLLSIDLGRTWRKVSRPAPLVDLVVDPRDSAHAVASTAKQLFFSRDEGRQWRQLGGKRSGFLAWPAPTRLYLVAGSGAVFTSRATAGPWVEVGDIDGEPAALLAQSDHELYVALHDGTIKRSADGGRTWLVRSTP